jgi:hypothetical protein
MSSVSSHNSKKNISYYNVADMAALGGKVTNSQRTQPKANALRGIWLRIYPAGA